MPPPPSAARRRPSPQQICWLALGAGIAIYAVLAMWLTRGATLFIDETSLFLTDRGLDVGNILTPLNGHLVAVERFVYALAFKLDGSDFVVLRIVQILGAALVAVLCFIFASRRVGPVLSVALTLLLLFLGSTWEVTFIPAGIANVSCLAAGVGAMLALDRGDRRGDVAACALLGLSLASWSLGVAFAIGIAIRVVVDRERAGRTWIFLVPVTLYAAWFVWARLADLPPESTANGFDPWNALLIPSYVAGQAAAVAGAIAGLDFDFHATSAFHVFTSKPGFGLALAVLGGAVLVLRIRRNGASASLVGLLAILLFFWVALALAVGPGRSPDTIRYAYPSAVVLLLVAAEAFRGFRPSRNVLLTAFGVVVLALGTNLARLREGMAFYRDTSTTLRAQLTAVEVARPQVDPGASVGGLVTVPVEPYLAQVDRIGSPAYSPSELPSQPESRRELTDSTLVTLLGIEPARATPSPCRGAVTERDPEGFAAGPGTVGIHSTTRAAVSISRYAMLGTPLGDVDASAWATIRIPADTSSTPWVVRVVPSDAARGSIEICERPG